MKKLLLATAAALTLSGAGFSQMGGMHEMMGGQGGMMPMMMQDQEMRKLIMEHMQKCREQMMNDPRVHERMLHMLTMHPEAFKEAIKKNPELKKKLQELLK